MLAAATSRASWEMSTATISALGKAKAIRMARQPEPVYMSIAAVTASGVLTHGLKPS